MSADEVHLAALALYKPPFRYEHGYIVDASGEHVSDDNESIQRVRGWGRISYLPNAESLQDKVGEMIATALNDYWQKHQPSNMPVPLSTEKQGTCSECGRGTWDQDEIGNQCFMVQPNSLLCLGVFVKVKQ